MCKQPSSVFVAEQVPDRESWPQQRECRWLQQQDVLAARLPNAPNEAWCQPWPSSMTLSSDPHCFFQTRKKAYERKKCFRDTGWISLRHAAEVVRDFLLFTVGKLTEKGILLGWREFKGQMNRGSRTESLWEANLPLRGSLRGSLRGGFSEFFQSSFRGFRGLLRSSEVFRGGFQSLGRGFQCFFRGLLRNPLRGRFPSQRLSVLLPLIVWPLELSPTRDAAQVSTRTPGRPASSQQLHVILFRCFFCSLCQVWRPP